MTTVHEGPSLLLMYTGSAVVIFDQINACSARTHAQNSVPNGRPLAIYAITAESGAPFNIGASAGNTLGSGILQLYSRT